MHNVFVVYITSILIFAAVVLDFHADIYSFQSRKNKMDDIEKNGTILSSDVKCYNISNGKSDLCTVIF